MGYMKELEKFTSYLENNLLEMKKSEIKRVKLEFLKNNYQGIYRVDISTVLSVIVGKYDLISEMKEFVSDKIEYFKSIELCRNFDIFK